MKNKILILNFLFLFFCGEKTLVAQEYIEARISMQIACYQEKNYDKCASIFFHQLSKKEKIFPTDWINYGAVPLSHLEQFDSAVWCIEQAILRGVTLESTAQNFHLKRIPENHRESLKKNYAELRGRFRASINEDLLKQVTSMHQEDQLARKEYRTNENIGIPWEPGGIDEINSKKLQNIMNIYGWPGFSLLGHESTKAYTILIHCSFDKSNDEDERKFYYPILKEALENREITPWMYAWYVDRYAVVDKVCQTYGTATSSGQPYVPIISPVLLNERRKEIGLSPFKEEDLKLMITKHACKD